MAIVEGVVLGAIVGTVVIGPIKGLLLANKLVQYKLEGQEKMLTIQEGDHAAVLLAHDFVDAEGQLHTHFVVSKTKQGEWVALSDSEVEIGKIVAYLKAAKAQGVEPGIGVIDRLIKAYATRVEEIRKSKPRQVEIRAV